MDANIYYSPRPFREIRAVFDNEIIRVYQAFEKDIASPALREQKFVAPFRFDKKVSWIKPSFLWVMNRTNWGSYCKLEKGIRQHEGNTMVLGIDIRRNFFDKILSIAQITHFEDDPNRNKYLWQSQMYNSKVLVQWDPEKTLEGTRQNFKAIQIGLKTPILREYVESIIQIEDMTDRIEKIISVPTKEEKIMLLPDEKPYSVNSDIEKGLNMSQSKMN